MEGGSDGDLALPHWTSRFTLSAQKGDHPPADARAAGSNPLVSPRMRSTPGLGMPRRVPLGSTGIENTRAPPAGRDTAAAKTMATPAAGPGGFRGDMVTPMGCLFDRFDALALDSVGATPGPTRRAGPPPLAPRFAPPTLPPTPLAAPTATPAGRAASSAAAAGAGFAPASAPRSPLGPARRVLAPPGAAAPPALAAAPGRVPAPSTASRAHGPPGRVSFGVTPVVHRYEGEGATGPAPRGTAAGTSAAAGGGAADDLEQRLRASAGRTPHSGRAVQGGLAGFSPVGAPDFCGGGDGQEVCSDGEQSAGGSGDEGAGAEGPGSGGFAFCIGAGTTAVATPLGPARRVDVTPTLFGAPPASPAAGRDATPTLFGAPPATAATRARDAGDEAAAVEDASNVMPFALPMPTPKASLRKPARVPNEVPRPPASKELRALLQEGPPPHTSTDGASRSGATASGQQQPLGSISKLSPVRASKKVQGSLGADVGQVLTPVRRSARKAPTATSRRFAPQQGPHGADVAPMLEATNFCYNGNPVLTPEAKGKR